MLGLEIMLVHLTSSKGPEGFNDIMRKTYDSFLYGGGGIGVLRESTIRNSRENKLCIRNHGSKMKETKTWHDYNNC